jgi:hypothetical protein
MVTRRIFHRLLMILVAPVILLSTVVGAQPIKPVFTSTSLDGQLLGVETDLQFGIWKPIASLAYGVGSGRFRYKAGLMLATGFEVPGLGQRLGDFRAALVDWPESPILGREGQSGIQVGWRLGNAEVSVFHGFLWSKEGEAPQVQYLVIDTSDAYELPFGLHLSSASQMVVGAVTASEQLFQSMTRTLSVSLGDLRLSGRWGMLENPAHLAGFEFSTGVRGIARSLTGHEFWNMTLERTFSMYESSLTLPLPSDWQWFLPASLPMGLRGAFFVQAGGATQAKERGGQTEMLFSWGLSATFFLHAFRLQAELIFAQDGETRFHFGF